MSQQYKRNPFLNTNKYQRGVIFSIMIPAIVTCAVCLLSLIYIHYIATHIIFYSNVDFNKPEMYIPWFLNLSRFTSIIPWLLLTITVMMLAAIVWSFEFTNKLLGPYDRVIRELDDVIAGKSKKPIILRPGDNMFIELFKRINTLIEKMPS